MLTIRKASVDDCGLIHDMAWQVFPQTYKDIISHEQMEYMMHWMYDVDNVRQQMESLGHVYFLAFDEGQPVGYVSVRPDGEERVHLEKIYVLPACQKSHVGSALFRQAVDYAYASFPRALYLELNMNRENPALGFYRRMGMRIDRQGDFPIGNGFYMNDYILRLDL